MKPVMLLGYYLGAFVTWVLLVIGDWHTVSGWRFLVDALVFDGVLAMLWPIFWLILRPFFGV